MPRFATHPQARLSIWLTAALHALALNALEMEWTPVLHPGNPPDKTGHGAVPYVFEISKTEITLGQYAEFLNAVAAKDSYGLWTPEMQAAPTASMVRDRTLIQRSGQPGSYQYTVPASEQRRPASFISFLDAMRFANWIHNGMGSGDTETGAYNIAEAKGLAVRQAGAKVWIPTEDEWYKAAYYQPQIEGGPESGYWLYPTRSNEPPQAKGPGDPAQNAASFGGGGKEGELHHTSYDFLPVASLPNASSPSGTFDQGGNVWEWNETKVFDTQRILRGGSTPHAVEKLRATVRSSASPHRKYPDTGFRLARPVAAQPTFPAP
jgi:formylglycine-generating enzyme required for sulfatase activity